MKKLMLVFLIASLFIVGCQPSADATQSAASQDPTVSPCTDRGWADITIKLYEFDRKMDATDPHGDITVMVGELEGTVNDIKEMNVDSCTENARKLIVAGLEDRIKGSQLIASGDDVSARIAMRDGFRFILSANEELIKLGIDLNYPKKIASQAVTAQACHAERSVLPWHRPPGQVCEVKHLAPFARDSSPLEKHQRLTSSRCPSGE